MIDIEKVKHIANLAKLEIDEKDMEKYQKQLSDILQDVEKIVKAEIPECDIMISPSANRNLYNEDKIGYHLSREQMFKNAKEVKGDYISVVRVVEWIT